MRGVPQLAGLRAEQQQQQQRGIGVGVGMGRGTSGVQMEMVEGELVHSGGEDFPNAPDARSGAPGDPHRYVLSALNCLPSTEEEGNSTTPLTLSQAPAQGRSGQAGFIFPLQQVRPAEGVHVPHHGGDHDGPCHRGRRPHVREERHHRLAGHAEQPQPDD